MLDIYVRPLINSPLDFIGKQFAQRNVSANTMTLIGFGAGLVAMLLIISHHYLTALVFILLNRLCDGIDGSIARHSQLSDFGGFLDIVCDFIVYAGIVFAFAFSHHADTLWSAFLIFSFIGPIASFLAYAILAAKHNLSTEDRGKKSFYYLGGLCEGTETAFTLILMCLFPAYFWLFCLIFGTMCWFTTMGRCYQAWVDFG